jgi:hypothetical protein
MASSAFFRFLLAMVTFAPVSYNASAVSYPTPTLEPVTITDLPDKSGIFSFVQFIEFLINKVHQINNPGVGRVSYNRRYTQIYETQPTRSGAGGPGKSDLSRQGPASKTALYVFILSGEQPGNKYRTALNTTDCLVTLKRGAGVKKDPSRIRPDSYQNAIVAISSPYQVRCLTDLVRTWSPTGNTQTRFWIKGGTSCARKGSFSTAINIFMIFVVVIRKKYFTI